MRADLNPVLFSQNPDQKPMVPGSIVTNPSPQTSNISDVSAEPGTLEPGMQTSSANDVILGYIRGIIQVYHNLLKLT